MKRISILIIIPQFFIVTPFTVVAQIKTDNGTHSIYYSRQQLTADIDFMIRTIEDVHPNPFHAISKENFQKLRDSVVKQFGDSMDFEKAWPALARIVASLNEGHSSIGFSSDFIKELRSDAGKLFPIQINEYKDEGLIVRTDLSTEDLLLPGDIILSINKRKVKDLMNLFTSCYGGISSWRNLQVTRDFPTNIQLHNIRSPFTVEYLHDGNRKTIIINGINFQEMINRLSIIRKKNAVMANPPDYSFTRLDDNIGYMNFRSMNRLEVFEKFLDSVFSAVKQQPISGLIIDLRQNSGGNSILGEKLLSFITDKPFRMGGGSTWKVSDEYKSFIKVQAVKNSVYATGSFQNYLKYETGKLITSNSDRPSKPGKNELRYRGKVCVLIGPNTFSSANMLSNAIQDYKLATLIGEATGEPPNDYGELYWIDLPNTKLTFYTCSKQFIRANCDNRDPNPVLPEIEVKQDPKSIKDDVLEYAKRWVKKQ